jgi:hypothetical protein
MLLKIADRQRAGAPKKQLVFDGANNAGEGKASSIHLTSLSTATRLRLFTELQSDQRYTVDCGRYLLCEYMTSNFAAAGNSTGAPEAFVRHSPVATEPFALRVKRRVARQEPSPRSSRKICNGRKPGDLSGRRAREQ